MSLRVPQLRFEASDQLAALCKAAGDPLRLNVLRALANDSFGVLIYSPAMRRLNSAARPGNSAW